MLVSFCVWCKVIGPGIGGLIADRPDLVRFQGCINHFRVFLCPENHVGRLLCLCVTLRLQEKKSNNNLQLLLFFKCTQTSFKRISGKHVASKATC